MYLYWKQNHIYRMLSRNETILINKHIVLKKREDLKFLNEIVSLESQVKAVKLQDTLGKQNFHEHMKKLFKPVADTIKNTSEDLTKSMMLTSKGNNKALENLNSKHLEIMKDRGLIASQLLSPLSKITNFENTSRFKFLIRVSWLK